MMNRAVVFVGRLMLLSAAITFAVGIAFIIGRGL